MEAKQDEGADLHLPFQCFPSLIFTSSYLQNSPTHLFRLHSYASPFDKVYQVDAEKQIWAISLLVRNYLRTFLDNMQLPESRRASD